MTTFNILKGSALGKAIAGQGKAVATFTAREHQLAYSALSHMEPASEGKAPSNDPKYINALYAVTPANYRRGLVDWACAFGRVTFDKSKGEFAYAKGKKADLDGALKVAPANFAKAAKKGVSKADVSLMDRVEGLAIKTIENDSASKDDRAFAKALRNFLNMHKGSILRGTATDKPAKAPKAAKVAKQESLPLAA